MTPERWHQITAIFHAALARGPSERETFLAAACRTDAMLRSDVDAMLVGHEGAGQFGEVPLLTSVSQPPSGPGVATLATGSCLGPYQILGPLGAGGMGQVYKAADPRLHRDVAIKVLPPVFTTDSDRLARFEREARVLAALNHPHIGAIYGLEETDGIRGLVLELVEGATLADRLKAGPVPVAEALSFGEQIAEALEAAHGKGIIHRDLKPANVKVTPEGQVKVLDFGLAKGILGAEVRQDPSQPATVLDSLAGQIVGTPPYMSPEQARGTAVDERTDIWAFGCLLYELLTGKRAFQGETSSDTITAVLEREPDWSALPAKTPARVRELLRQCLQKGANRRLPDIADARKTMLATAAGERAPAQQRRGYRWALRAGAALTLILLAVLGWRLRASGEAPGKSIAVLPFASLSAGEDNAYFAEGIHGELLNRLSQIADLKVISRTSVQQYKTGARNLREIGEQLGVAAILEGSVQRAGNRVRIEVQLVDARKDHQLWADRYDRDLSDIFQIQSAVAEEIASKLHARLSTSERSAIERRPTKSREAWGLYLRGEGMRLSGLVGDLPAAERLFRKAIEVDPSFAPAIAQLSRVLDEEWFRGVVPDTARRVESRALAERARELQKDLPEAHLALGLDLYHATRDYAAAEHEFRLALASAPGCAECIGYIGYLQRRQGRWKDALASLARSLDLDPRNEDVLSMLVRTFFDMRRYADALAATDRQARASLHPELVLWRQKWLEYQMGGDARPLLDVLAKMPPGMDGRGDFTFSRWRMAMIERRFDDALAVLRSTSLEMLTQDFVSKADLQGQALAAAGRKAEARAAFEEARAAYERLLRVRPDDPTALMELARVDANLGRAELAHREAAQASALLPETKDAVSGVELSAIHVDILIATGELDAALAETERLATVNGGFVREDLEMPIFDPLRPHPRFQRVLARLQGR